MALREHIRQGDVILFPVDAEPKGEQVKPVAGRVVLAIGEATGHAHTLDAADCTLVSAEGAQELYLIVHGRTQLEHQEHAALTVDPGVYLIGSPDRRAGIAQVEYTPDALQRVAD